MMSITLGRPSEDVLASLVARGRDEPFTYGEVGATAATILPDGYHHDRARVELGHGSGIWEKARHAVQTWQGHRYAGATVSPANATLCPGTVVITSLSIGPFFVMAPCRIVYATAEPDRFGFAYGTLPGHPERGEEAFHVLRDASGVVAFEIVAFSRPAAALARVGSPLARAIQQRTTRRYLEGVRTSARDEHA
jgi:uncharacterized protein (UPF0548 family)